MMKFLSVLVLAALAGALVCGEENISDATPPELVDNAESSTSAPLETAVNPEAPEEIISKSVTVPAEASSDFAQKILAAEKSEENQEATTQKAVPRLSILKTAANFMKNKIEDSEEKIKNIVNTAKELKNLPRKLVKAYVV